ncbi:MAG: Acyl-CoA dehydrogenase C-terminal domain-containing protein, partial [Bacteroidales bacterium]
QFGKAIINFPAVYEMLGIIKAKLQASRAILYETTRFVDIYKAYNLILDERKLTPEERTESKLYNKYADMFTPILKMMSSEYANQNAYDAIQIHGGSGFMKEYAVERLYRDARILTIYEGTSQLQTVAAIRYVTNGSYLAKIREYQQKAVRPEFEAFKTKLIAMTEQYEQTCALVADKGNEYIDFHARRLVEMAAHIIMSYLLLLDSQSNANFIKSAEIYTNKAESWNTERYSYIANFKAEDLQIFASVKDEKSENTL